jgi:hypothetical protein
VLWLQTPPWGRWIAATLIAAGALWVELRPVPSVPHPFASADIAAGEEIGAWNSRTREVPAGLFDDVAAEGIATVAIPEGDPILASHLAGDDAAIPSGWWRLDVALPQGADRGDEARVILVDSGETVPAVVASGASDDPLGTGMGSVAVEPERAAEVAAAASEGRVAIMVLTP